MWELGKAASEETGETGVAQQGRRTLIALEGTLEMQGPCRGSMSGASSQPWDQVSWAPLA